MRLKKSLLSSLIAASLLCGAPAFAAVQVNPIRNISPDFIKGADVSMLPAMEEAGAKYRDVDGQQMDALAIMQKHGVNWIRVRLWVAPDKAQEGGYTTEARGIELAKRAKALGLKVLVDYHYTDFWADGNQQYTPKPWKNLDEKELAQAVYDYTQKTLADFQAAGAAPDMVQIGNEIMAGFLWPIGRLPAADGGAAFAHLVESGLRATHDFDPAIQTMIHVQDGGDNAACRAFFDQLITENGVSDFDSIGLSCYPFWHAPASDFAENMQDLAARYGKQVIVAETAAPFTLEDPDASVKGGKNHCGAAEARTGGFLPTVQGQASSLRAMMQDVADVKDGRGLGIFYWAPDWYDCPGVGWTRGEGNNWDNLAMFDRNGKALESWDVFRDVSDQSLPTIAAAITEIAPLAVSGSAGIPVQLPKTAFVTYSDDSTRDVPVTWDTPAPVFPADGEYAAQGTLASGERVTCAIQIAAHANLLQNGDFETVDFSGWQQQGTTTLAMVAGSGDAIGSGAAHYWAPKGFEFTLSQEVTNLPDGLYTAEVSTQGKGAANRYELFVETGGERQTAAITDAGWANWGTTRLKDIAVKDGKAIVGIYQNGKADNWGSIDNVKFYRQ